MNRILQMVSTFRFRHVGRLLRGILIVTAVTAFCYFTHLNNGSVVLLYVIAVVLHSLDCSFAEAAAICLLATVALDYFFTEPLYSLTVSGPLEAITLVCLLSVTLVITRIQSRNRAEVRESTLQRSSMKSLFEVSQHLLGLPPLAVAGTSMLEGFLSAFDLEAVYLFDAATLEAYAAGERPNALEAKTRECFITGQDASYPEVGIVVQCLRARDTTYGAIGFKGLRNSGVAAPALAALVVAALERSRAFRAATSAAVQAEAEALRSAILDALAHEFKTPLATILTAAGGLFVGESISPEQAELAQMIEVEASRLGDLTTRLLRLARVDREELKPRLLDTDVSELTLQSIRRYSRLWPDRRISCHQTEEVGDVSVDPELIGLTISQLLENACRYSLPDTTVRVELTASDDMAVIEIWNAGAPIPEGERERIFERFYRGAEARKSAPGSGLGLYVARKIARAHGGDLIVNENANNQEVGFRLTMPLSTKEGSGAEREL